MQQQVGFQNAMPAMNSFDGFEAAVTKGVDRLNKARRSWNMSRIRGKDTTPEKIVRPLLHRIEHRAIGFECTCEFRS